MTSELATTPDRPKASPDKPGRPRRTGLAPATLQRRRHRVMARMWAAAESQLDEIEARLASLETGHSDRERGTRSLALLARVVRDLSLQVRADEERGLPGKAPSRRSRGGFPAISRNDEAEASDAQTARSLDQLRDDLARHLQRLRDERGAAGSPGDAV